MRLILLLAGTSLLGYLLPASMVLREMTVRQSSRLPESFSVTGRLTLFGEEAHHYAQDQRIGLSGDQLEMSGELSLSPGRCSWTLGSLVLNDERGQVHPTAPLWAAWLTKLACEPFLYRDGGADSALAADLRRLGGDPNQLALTLLDGQVAYLLGAAPGKTGLALAKGALVPLRIWTEESGIQMAVDFNGYATFFHGGGFPTTFALSANGAQLAIFTVRAQRSDLQ